MGCDIHGAIEKKVGDKWVMVTRLKNDLPSCDRNYKRFTKLADVRSEYNGEGPKPKGFPVDVSDSTKLYSDEWGADGHSHSWLYLDDAIEIYKSTCPDWEKHSDYTKKYPWNYFFDLDKEDGAEYRFVFWFDN